jgi:hypothetical protein
MGSRGAEVKKTFRARTTAKGKLEKKTAKKVSCKYPIFINTSYSTYKSE